MHLRGTAELCGWKVVEINGHDNEQILDALQLEDDKPILIIIHCKKEKVFHIWKMILRGMLNGQMKRQKRLLEKSFLHEKSIWENNSQIS